MARKSRLFAYSISSPDSGSPNLRWDLPKVSGLVREYPRFAETIGGDWFDHDCRPMSAVGFGGNKVLRICLSVRVGWLATATFLNLVNRCRCSRRCNNADENGFRK